VTPRPPTVARRLIRLLVPRPDRSFVLQDLDERFREIHQVRGARAARRWYRRQALLSLPVLLTSLAEGLMRGLGGGDLRSTIRVLLRRPQYSGGVAGTLALGFASAMVLGGLAWQVWLEPLPLPDAERLVHVYELEPGDGAGERTRFQLSPPMLQELRERDWRHLTGFAGILQSSPEWRVDGDVRHLRGALVSPGFFQVLGVAPLHGRADLGAGDDTGVPAAVLTEEFWLRAFGGDPGVVGSTLDLGGVAHTVAGVVPQNGEYPGLVDLFTPLRWEPHQLAEGFRGARYVETVGRVAPSSTIEVASGEISAFAEALGDAWPSHVGWSGEVVSLRADLVRPYRPALRLLLVAGLAFLALSLVNVFGLSMARALERSPESAVRMALGASRGRLGRTALLEGAALGLVGGVGALAAAQVATAASMRWLPEGMPRTGDLGLSWVEGAIWLAVAVTAGAVVVALARWLVPVAETPTSGTRVSPKLVGGRPIVIGQFALTTLLVGVGALAWERSMELVDRDLGFVADGVWTGLVALPQSLDGGWEERRDTWAALLRELEDRGYQAAISTNPPMSGSNNRFDYRRFREDEQRFGQYAIVSPDYFDVMGIRIVEGRTFHPGESEPAVIISLSLADEVLPGESPVGLSLFILQEDREIIGVAESTAHFGPDTPPPPMMYASFDAENWAFTRLVVAGGEGALQAIPAAVESAIPGARPVSVIPYRRHLSEWFRPLRIQLGIVGALALIGSLLAALGLYSAVAFHVRGRRTELGIRVALGATRRSILAVVVRRGLVMAGVGLSVGMALWWSGRGILSEALGATGTGLSAGSVAFTTAAILGLALVAVTIPARRAAATDPLESFRAD